MNDLAENLGERITEELLVSLLGLSERIKVSPYYYNQGLPGTSKDCFVREGIAKKLMLVAVNLPHNHFLVVLDGWRSYETQLALYQSTKESFIKENPNLLEDELHNELSKFVAVPSKDKNKPAPHYTGGAVDLTIANEHGWLDMGTDFDEFTENAQSNFYETKANLTDQEKTICFNRRMLKNAMEGAGFISNYDEWWHYEYGNPQWAAATQKSPIYMGIDM